VKGSVVKVSRQPIKCMFIHVKTLFHYKKMNTDNNERSAISGTNCLDELVEESVTCSGVNEIVSG